MRRIPTSPILSSGLAVLLSISALPAAYGQADHDKDGVVDLEDDCPTDPGQPSNRGCPGDPPPPPAPEPLVQVSDTQVEIKKSIEFETGSAKLRPTAEPILQAVAEAISQLPADRRVRVRGHTDSRGKLTSNVRLSAQRAESVRTRLQALGIDKARLEIEGVGPKEPIADNGTEEGRAKNRRVEFQILGSGAAP